MADHEFLAKHAVSQSTRPARFAAAHALADGCPNGHALQKFYTQVFGWQMQPLPGMTDSLMVPAQKDGIAGGIRASTNHQPRVAVYVTVGDIDAITMVQLPALNTPQFRWVKSRLPRKAQPVPPIYQPEVAADAIVAASQSTRREVYVGWPTWLAIVAGAKLAPAAGDRYLGRTGYDGQQTCEPADPAAANNLFAPVKGDHGAHGVFDARARGTSLQSLATMNRGLALGLLALTGAAAAACVYRSLR